MPVRMHYGMKAVNNCKNFLIINGEVKILQIAREVGDIEQYIEECY